MRPSRSALAGLLLLAGLACGGLGTDAATRLATDLRRGLRVLGTEEGARATLRSNPLRGAEAGGGSYEVQFDRAGALVVWCRDAEGRTTCSHSTSSHAPSVDTPRTWKVTKSAREPLVIQLTRRGGRAVIVAVD